MKIYLLGVCGVLCALSSVSHGIITDEDLDNKLKSLECPPGQLPAKVMQFSTTGWLTKAECIDESLKNSQEKIVPTEKQKTTQAPNEGTELDNKTVPKECPSAHQLVNMSSFCPADATVASSCPLSDTMACVPQPFGNKPAGRWWRGHEPESGQSIKTEAELNSEMAHKSCITDQKPTKISTWCRTGARDIIGCDHTEVWCVQESSTTASKTAEELEREILDLICPPAHQPTLIRGMCPIGSKSSTDCEESRKACRPVAVDDRHSFGKFNGWDRDHHRGHWGQGFRHGPGWGRWRGRH